MATKSNAGSGILLFCLLATACSFPRGSTNAQSKKTEPQPKTVVLKILNGKTGWPIWAELPNVWLGGANSPIDPPPRTNWRGEIKLKVPATGPREVRVLPNWYVDCRDTGDQMAGGKVKYSVDQILELGIVTDNVCGKTRAKPIPGTLVLYVRPRTWKEIMEL